MKEYITHPQRDKANYCQKSIIFNVREMFLDFGGDEMQMSLAVINSKFFNNNIEPGYLNSILRESLKVEMRHTMGEYDGQPIKICAATRYTYPTVEQISEEPGKPAQKVRVDVYDFGRPYVFKRDQFLTAEEIKSYPPCFPAAGKPAISTQQVNQDTENQFTEDLKNLVIYLQNINDGGGHLFELRNDFLVEAFTQLAGSERFAGMRTERRQDLFSQYQSLAFTLGELEEFFRKYSDANATLVTGTYTETEAL